MLLVVHVGHMRFETLLKNARMKLTPEAWLEEINMSSTFCNGNHFARQRMMLDLL